MHPSRQSLERKFEALRARKALSQAEKLKRLEASEQGDSLSMAHPDQAADLPYARHQVRSLEGPQF